MDSHSIGSGHLNAASAAHYDPDPSIQLTGHRLKKH
jgi:hypothetical protein